MARLGARRKRLRVLALLGAALAAAGVLKSRSTASGAGTASRLRISGGARIGAIDAARNSRAFARLSLSTDPAYPAGTGCPAGARLVTPWMQVSIDERGMFQSEFPLASLSPGAGSPCRIDRIAVNQVLGARLEGVIRADSSSCAALCGGTAGCRKDCESKLEIAASTEAGRWVEDSDALWVRADLDFSTPGPASGGSAAPDLQVNPWRVSDSISLETETLEADSCAIEEGCVSGPGPRRLLRFESAIQNRGGADWVKGDPASSESFEFSACHEHYHLPDVYLYELRHEKTDEPVRVGGVPVTGRKQGFCLRDDYPIWEERGSRFDCEFQGITAGWEDVYDASLECQWIDVTGVSPGSYRLRLTVNPDAVHPDSDLSNNSVEVPVSIPEEGA